MVPMLKRGSPTKMNPTFTGYRSQEWPTTPLKTMKVRMAMIAALIRAPEEADRRATTTSVSKALSTQTSRHLRHLKVKMVSLASPRMAWAVITLTSLQLAKVVLIKVVRLNQAQQIKLAWKGRKSTRSQRARRSGKSEVMMGLGAKLV